MTDFRFVTPKNAPKADNGKSGPCTADGWNIFQPVTNRLTSEALRRLAQRVRLASRNVAGDRPVPIIGSQMKCTDLATGDEICYTFTATDISTNRRFGMYSDSLLVVMIDADECTTTFATIVNVCRIARKAKEVDAVCVVTDSGHSTDNELAALIKRYAEETTSARVFIVGVGSACLDAVRILMRCKPGLANRTVTLLCMNGCFVSPSGNVEKIMDGLMKEYMPNGHKAYFIASEDNQMDGIHPGLPFLESGAFHATVPTPSRPHPISMEVIELMNKVFNS